MEKLNPFQTDPSLKLMDRVHQALSYYQYSYRTELSYCRWIKEYITFLKLKKIPKERFQHEIGSFLNFLSREKKMAESTQRQALNAIVFLYKRVFDVKIDVKIEPAKTRKKLLLPVVMTKQEIETVLSGLKAGHFLMAGLMYGSGLRLMECLRLRITHLDFKQNIIQVNPAKGGRARTVMMPRVLKKDLLRQMERVRQIHKKDLAMGYGQVALPGKIKPVDKMMGKEFAWQYVFPSKRRCTDPITGLTQRSHVLESGLQKAVKTAVKKAGIKKSISCNTFRHSFATHLLENDVNIKKVQALMGHADIKTTEIYTHVMTKKEGPVLSPLDVR